jgi:hypothetical protein
MVSPQPTPVLLLPISQRRLWAGTSGPASSTPSRPRGSIRRTTSIDVTFSDDDRWVTLTGRGRDLLTPVDGPAQVLDVAGLAVRLESCSRIIGEIHAQDGSADLAGLIGRPATYGFRRQIRTDFPELTASGSLLALLLDDVPPATMISAGSLVRRNAVPDAAPWVISKIDVCAGWASGGVMARAQQTGPRHVGEGPIAPSLDGPSDRLAWHSMPVLPTGSVRRRRRIDVSSAAAGAHLIDVLFRDSYFEPDGGESGVHEYGLHLEADAADHITSIDVRAGVLPGPQCAAALDSAQLVVGRTMAELREHVEATFRGVSTCTHLNDALRSISDVGSLLRSGAGG